MFNLVETKRVCRIRYTLAKIKVVDGALVTSAHHIVPHLFSRIIMLEILNQVNQTQKVQ
jgi:hypothetical protein